MPWMECDRMSEKVKFIARLLDGERMADLCREFGISRKTGYKFLERYQTNGFVALDERTKRPHRSPSRTPSDIVKLITELRNAHPSWGAPKIRNYLVRKHPNTSLPVSSTIHVILERAGLVLHRPKRGRFKAKGTNLIIPENPNDLWCADYKGQFRLLNSCYCYPLTITDLSSRFLLCVEALEGTKEDNAIETFRRTFGEFGLPNAIRTDNGVPFSTRTLFGLSKLSVWWLRLGIRLERIEPGCPQQNGSHERMHLTLAQSATKPPGKNQLQQQEVFDSFRDVFNQDRPHDGIDAKVPADLYRPSPREYPTVIPDIQYDSVDKIITVSNCGSIQVPGGNRVFISAVLGNQPLALRMIDDGVWAVSFMQYTLGYYDNESYKFTPKEKLEEADEPCATEDNAKVSPMSPE